MLWILLGISLICLIISSICDQLVVKIWSGICLFVFAVILVGGLGSYGSTKATVSRQIEILEQRNEEIIAQVEPLVEQYLKYEPDILKDLKLSAGKIIAIAQSPDLKDNEFVQLQIKTVLENQEKITTLKLEKADLGSYKPWIFMGE